MSKKVTITAIKKAVKENTVKDLNIDIKQYNGIQIKEAIVRLIIQNCMVDGKINYCVKEMAYEMAIVRNYTNIDFSTVDSADEDKMIDKLIELYDLLKENGIIEYIIEEIKIEELYFIRNCLTKQLEEEVKTQELSNQSEIIKILKEINAKETFEDVLKSFLKNIESKIPDKDEIIGFLGSMSKEFKDLDPTKLKSISKILNINAQPEQAKMVKNSKKNVEKVVKMVKDEIK